MHGIVLAEMSGVSVWNMLKHIMKRERAFQSLSGQPEIQRLTTTREFQEKPQRIQNLEFAVVYNIYNYRSFIPL